jgi:hypothetical protein
MIRPFTQGNSDTVQRINELVAAINRLENFAGDGLVRVTRTISGWTISLNIDEVNARMPKAAGGGTAAAGNAITMYEVAADLDPEATETTYKLRPQDTAAWVNGTSYTADGYTKDSGEETYKCTASHKAGGDSAHDTNTAYSVGARVYSGTPNNNTYKCILAVAANQGIAVTDATYWTLDNDEPGVGNAWEDYWTAATITGHVFQKTADSWNLNYCVPKMTTDWTAVPTVVIGSDVYLLQRFFYVAAESSIAWDDVNDRLVSVFGG